MVHVGMIGINNSLIYISNNCIQGKKKNILVLIQWMNSLQVMLITISPLSL